MYTILILLCFSQITFKNGRTQIAKGGYPKLKPCSDVNEKTQSKFIGCVHKNTAVSTLRFSLNHGLSVSRCLVCWDVWLCQSPLTWWVQCLLPISGARLSVISQLTVIFLASTPTLGTSLIPFRSIKRPICFLLCCCLGLIQQLFKQYLPFSKELSVWQCWLILASLPSPLSCMQMIFGGCLLGDIIVQQQQPFLTMVMIHEVLLAVSLLAARVL